MSDTDGLLVEFTEPEPEPEPARADGLLVQLNLQPLPLQARRCRPSSPPCSTAPLMSQPHFFFRHTRLVSSMPLLLKSQSALLKNNCLAYAGILKGMGSLLQFKSG